MNKKALVVLSSLLVSMPIFAKELFSKRLMQFQRHSLVKTTDDQTNFSGSWVGKCNLEQEQFPLKIKISQNEKILTLTFDEGDKQGNPKITFKFPIEHVKVKSAGALNSSEHSMSYAIWTYGNHLSVSTNRIGMETSNEGNSNYVNMTSFGLDLALENGKLFFYRAYGEEPFCDFEKQV
ncbi:MAG: hypothetical protein H2069_02380 [Legionella sp.]|nr:hypothetical protein [Legionella sp.]